jgi:hypothetical protein
MDTRDQTSQNLKDFVGKHELLAGATRVDYNRCLQRSENRPISSLLGAACPSSTFTSTPNILYWTA